MAVLASLGGQLVGVGVAVGPAQGRSVPAGLHLPREGVYGLPALRLGGDPHAHSTSSAGVGKAPTLGGGWVWQCLEAQFGGNGLVGRGAGQVQQLPQGPERLILNRNRGKTNRSMRYQLARGITVIHDRLNTIHSHLQISTYILHKNKQRHNIQGIILINMYIITYYQITSHSMAMAYYGTVCVFILKGQNSLHIHKRKHTLNMTLSNELLYVSLIFFNSIFSISLFAAQEQLPCDRKLSRAKQRLCHPVSPIIRYRPATQCC